MDWSRGWELVGERQGLWQEQVPKALHELLGREAPDVGIEAVGVHYVKSMLHKVGSRHQLLSKLHCASCCAPLL